MDSPKESQKISSITSLPNPQIGTALYDTNKIKIVLRQMFVNENPKNLNDGIILFKINDEKFHSLMKKIKKQSDNRFQERSDETESDKEENPLFKMGLKWFNRIN